MPATEPETAARHPAEVPLYTPWDVARYLRLPLWAVLHQGLWHHPEELFHIYLHRFHDRWAFDDDLPGRGGPWGPERLSFRDLAGLFVRAGAVQALNEWTRSGSDSWQEFFDAVRRRLEEAGRNPVVFGDGPVGELADRVAKAFTRLSDTQLALVRKWIARRLERVEVVDGAAVRLYPFSRDPAENSPRLIVLDPLVRFGRPCVADRGVPTDALFERHQAGDSVAELADDYGLTAEEVEEALRFETAPVFPYSFPHW